jgi:putative membrane protein
MTTSHTQLPDATALALDRTRLAYERTLMAWVRTSTSLISFGFTIYKFFQYLRESQSAAPENRLFGAREYALLMIGVGVVALVLATLDHRRSLHALKTSYGPVRYSLAMVLAAFMSVVGAVALAAVLFRQ